MSKFSYLVLFSLFISVACGITPAFAQSEYFENFQSDIDEYYDMQQGRIDYYEAYVENRKQLDERRTSFQQPKQDALANYETAVQSGLASIDYEAGESKY